MDVIIARTYKNELQKKISDLLNEYEKTTKIEVDSILISRQSQSDSLGNEIDFNYAVEVKSYI